MSSLAQEAREKARFVAQLQVQLDTAERTSQSQAKAIAELNEHSTQLRKSNAEMQSRLNVQDGTIALHVERIRQLSAQQRAKDTRPDCLKFSSAFTMLKEQNNELHGRIVRLEDVSDEKGATISKLRQQVSVLEAQTGYGEYARQQTAHVFTIGDLEGRLDDKNWECQQQRTRISELERERDSGGWNPKDEPNARICMLERQLQDEKHFVSEKSNEIMQLIKTAEDLRFSLGQEVRNSNEKSQKITALDSQLVELRKEIWKLKTRSSTSQPTDYAAAVREWHYQTIFAFAKPANMTTFPVPPIANCSDAACKLKPGIFHPVCTCSIKAAFKSLQQQGLNMKQERKRFHPDKFSSCPPSKVDEFKQKANDVFVVADALP